MEHKFSQGDVVKNKNEAIARMSKYLDECIIQDYKHMKKANLISYWLKEHTNYLQREETFNSFFLKKYSRGNIIKANLGFNVGNEEGGLHYCVVLDKKNVKSYSTLTVVPLSSFKSTSKPNKTSVFLGNEIYITLQAKSAKMLADVKCQIELTETQLHSVQTLPTNTEDERIIREYKINALSDLIRSNKEQLNLIGKINLELKQMKHGSIALVNQITTISKMRIYDPKKDLDILSGISLSNDQMKLIDEKIKKLYIN